MDKVDFLVIFPTYAKLEVVRETLPSVIAEVERYGNARLIVHDSTEPHHGQEGKWQYLRELEMEKDFFLLLSTNMSMAHARNMCLTLGQEMYAPEYICMIEDDHGFHAGLLESLTQAMRKYYGKVSPNGLRFGMFSGCTLHTHAHLTELESNYSYPTLESDQFSIGGANSCFRCAPANHWYSVLKGYDTDEYLISNYQTANLRWRNYHKGFTVMYVRDGDLVFEIDTTGRGETASKEQFGLWDRDFAKSDKRSMHLGKSPQQMETAKQSRQKLQVASQSRKESILGSRKLFRYLSRILS